MAADLQPVARATDRQRLASAGSPTLAVSGATRVRRGRRWKRSLIGATGIAIVAVSCWYAIGKKAPKVAAPSLTHTLVRRDLQVVVTESGTLESSNNTEVRCKVKGATNTIVWIIKNGAEVKAGDVLVKIDTSTIETNINTQEIAYQNALAAFAQSQSDVAVAEINITEYLEGTYRSTLKTKEKDVAIAQANLRSAQNMLDHAKEMYRKGFLSKLELEGNEYSLQQAELELEVKVTDADVLTRYTKAKQIQDLNGILAAKKAKLASDKAALDLEKLKLDREKQQLANCVITAEAGGMVTYSSGQEWEDRPDIREGATVREDQVLLLIPDLSQMQVKVGVHEALIGQVKPDLSAEVELQEQKHAGTVVSIAPMAERAGWWNGNMVKYETIIKLDTENRLKPGMSATVRIILADHTNILAMPVGAVVEHDGEFFCWVTTAAGTERRALTLGDSDDQFLVVHSGVTEGETVVLNPIAHIEEAQRSALKPFDGLKSQESKGKRPDSEEPGA